MFPRLSSALIFVTLLTQAFASPSPGFEKRAKPPSWAGLQVNDDTVREYCNEAPTQWSVDRRACFVSSRDITQAMTTSDHIYGYRSGDGKADSSPNATLCHVPQLLLYLLTCRRPELDPGPFLPTSMMLGLRRASLAALLFTLPSMRRMAIEASMLEGLSRNNALATKSSP
ncbi:uncharacterized protein UTRI_04991_B [Ustilago trichophora]|uniref:Uncharacterized protein n=1 Tax=Ustilago trichophora TaxID=86804 RepID=A0A5C3EFD2_9BASI|nr:uncharacterized protein UTRI_04991_B [Ustilago trichophora]